MIATTDKGIPLLGLGTYGRTGPEGLSAISAALEVSYRHIDTAQTYDSETNVGAAIRDSGLPREELFVTTKVSEDRLSKADFLPSVERSLAALNLEQVDLLLIHWPSSGDRVPIEDYLTDLAEAQSRGWTRLVGVSNFTIPHLERTDEILGLGSIATNQVEIHPYLRNPKLTSFAAARGLNLTAYMPLAQGRVGEDAILKEIAEAHGVTAAAISLAFLMQQGHVAIPASSNEGRLRENFAALTVSLSEDEMARIAALDSGTRIIDPPIAPRWDDR